MYLFENIFLLTPETVEMPLHVVSGSVWENSFRFDQVFQAHFQALCKQEIFTKSTFPIFSEHLKHEQNKEILQFSSFIYSLNCTNLSSTLDAVAFRI